MNEKQDLNSRGEAHREAGEQAARSAPDAHAVAGAQAVEMPAPTIWPLVLALGITLAASGLVTNFIFSIGGIVLTVAGLAGWIGQLLPGVGEVELPVRPPAERVQPETSRRTAEAAMQQPSRPRARLPETVTPYSAGILGGLAGGVAMAVVALLYGWFSGRGIWYPVNLLAAMLNPGAGEMGVAQLEQFSLLGITLGVMIHGAASLAVGLLFALLLPMLPGRPLLWGGFVGPVLWTGGVYAFMGVLNPVMNAHVDWAWFVVSQFAFGLVTGLFVERFEMVPSSTGGGKTFQE